MGRCYLCNHDEPHPESGCAREGCHCKATVVDGWAFAEHSPEYVTEHGGDNRSMELLGDSLRVEWEESTYLGTTTRARCFPLAVLIRLLRQNGYTVTPPADTGEGR